MLEKIATKGDKYEPGRPRGPPLECGRPPPREPRSVPARTGDSTGHRLGVAGVRVRHNVAGDGQELQFVGATGRTFCRGIRIGGSYAVMRLTIQDACAR